MAASWWQKAADQGVAEAQYKLGCSYAQGLGVAQDDAEALSWWRKAAEQSVNMAQYEVGCCYAEGKGVSQDYAEAVAWWQEAAKQGVAMAQYELACCYAEGNGVLQDDVMAVLWWYDAAEQGVALAQYEYGCCCAEGRGVEQNSDEAARWWNRAAKQGVASAQYELARRYAEGTVPEIIDGDEEFHLLESLPIFKGGDLSCFRRWVMERIKYPQIAQENGIQGDVVVEFVIDKAGQLSRIKVLESPDKVLSDAAISVLQKSPRWIPGTQRGNPVKVKYVLSIAFKLQD